MKLIATLDLFCCSVHSAESGRVAGALMRERLRVDDARQSTAQVIASATERFAGYYLDVDTRNDVKRLDRAFRAFGRAVRRKARQRLEVLRDRARRETLRSVPAERA